MPTLEIIDLLKLIEMLNNQIKREPASGSPEDCLAIHQSKYLRDRHIRELNEILNEFDFNLQSLL
jgi:hypothetical protein